MSQSLQQASQSLLELLKISIEMRLQRKVLILQDIRRKVRERIKIKLIVRKISLIKTTTTKIRLKMDLIISSLMLEVKVLQAFTVLMLKEMIWKG